MTTRQDVERLARKAPTHCDNCRKPFLHGAPMNIGTMRNGRLATVCSGCVGALKATHAVGLNLFKFDRQPQ